MIKMKTRIIYGVLFGLLGIAIVIFPMSALPDIVIFAAVMVGTYELQKTVGVKNKLVYAMSMAFSALVIAYSAYAPRLDFEIPVIPVVTAYCMIMLALTVFDFGRTTFQHVGLSMVSSFLVSGAVGCYLRIRNFVYDYEGVLTIGHIRFIIWFCLAGAVFADTFALFTGVKFGKKKLCPRVSPKKTVEGAIGGVIGSAVINIIAIFVCNAACSKPFPVPVWAMVILAFVLPVVSMLGDLVASTIKRNYGIKDFGHIIPGHGGIMDRIDSIGFVAPFMYGVLSLLLKAFA